jgi:hypothetical protein
MDNQNEYYIVLSRQRSIIVQNLHLPHLHPNIQTLFGIPTLGSKPPMRPDCGSFGPITQTVTPPYPSLLLVLLTLKYLLKSHPSLKIYKERV